MHCDALGRELGLGSGRELDGRGGRGQLGRRTVGLTAAGAATAASRDGRLSRYDGAATLASTVGVDACGSDSR